MTTASGAYAVIKSRIEANRPKDSSNNNILLFWQNQDAATDNNIGLPETPAPFAYTEFVTDPGRLLSFGGGRGANLYRNPARIDAYVFVPRGQGVVPATDIAEQFATLFRSYRDSDIQCFDATVYPLGDGSSLKPPGLSSDVGNYYCAVCEVSLHFDLIG